MSLCLSLFPWASFRRTKAGVKLHTLLDHDGYLPAFVSITPAREHEIKKARALNLPKGSIVVEDLGYTDYAWYGQVTAQKIFFVTRQKSNARYRVLARRPVNTALGLVSDETIQLSGAKARECPKPLRRIVYQDPETNKVYVFLTNHFRLVAKTIADIYKERWQIEIFFRWIKQNLKIKAFIGNSENAVMSQIYAALIVYLLLCYTKFICNLSVHSMPGVWRHRHQLVFCWLVVMQIVTSGARTLSGLSQSAPGFITEWRFRRLLSAGYWSLKVLLHWFAEEAIKSLPTPENKVVYVIADGSKKDKRGQKNPAAQKGRMNEHHAWFFGIKFVVLMVAWDNYRIPVDFQMVLPKGHPDYKKETGLCTSLSYILYVVFHSANDRIARNRLNRNGLLNQAIEEFSS